MCDHDYKVAMKKEHSSKKKFECDLFKTSTTPKEEWGLVMGQRKSSSSIRNLLRPLAEYIDIGKKYNLREEEVISLVLASGPMVC